MFVPVSDFARGGSVRRFGGVPQFPDNSVTHAGTNRTAPTQSPRSLNKNAFFTAKSAKVAKGRSTAKPAALRRLGFFRLAHSSFISIFKTRIYACFLKSTQVRFPGRCTNSNNRFGLSGISQISRPCSARASSTAWANSGPTGMAPASPAPLMPSGFSGERVST